MKNSFLSETLSWYTDDENYNKMFWGPSLNTYLRIKRQPYRISLAIIKP